MPELSNLLIPAAMFFALGFTARLIGSDLRFPPDLGKALSIYLLVAIGIHGGYELGRADLAVAVHSILWALALGLFLPVVGYLVLTVTRRVDPLNAAAIAAHYGSVSAGTFVTAVAYLDAAGISYESYPIIMLAIMESPAIIVGIALAIWARRGGSGTSQETDDDGSGKPQITRLLHEAFTNGSVVLLIGSMVIGALAAPTAVEAIKPFMREIFLGVLCLFLLEMGMEAARRIGDFRKVGMSLIVFGILMPLFGGVIGALVGALALDFSIGGTLLVAVLAASASYIAVPTAMRLAVPEANPSLYLTLSLGITFPFNVVAGIPLYHSLAGYLVST